MNGITAKIALDEHILRSLREDMPDEDVSTSAVISEPKTALADLRCKQDGVLAGIGVFQRVFELLDERSVLRRSFSDGDRIQSGEVVAVLECDVRAMLSGERTALNYLQRMCGIATYTAEAVGRLKGGKTVLTDTRKTTPGMRLFEKYAVRVGGGGNHRYSLSDGVLLKDNHISAAGGVARAVRQARAYAPFVRKIEVEVESLDMLREALDAGADIIMLDNMNAAALKEAVRLTAGRALLECSGNVTKETAALLAETGVDVISSGALTHSAGILDLSLKNLRYTDASYDMQP
jgi:nicotinate-nucleotide pyrophosphorylase (carboxylating)